MTEPAAPPITRDDIERKLRGVLGDLSGTTEVVGRYARAAAGVAVVAAVAIAFGLGRRRGRNQQTVVQVRRI